MELPTRLPIGKIYLGPDFPGCINSGNAPALLHSRKLESAVKFELTDKRFIVGPEGAIQEFLHANVVYARMGRVWTDHAFGTIYLYKNAAPAKAKFLALCADMDKKRQAVAAERRTLRAQAATGDPNGMVALACHMLDHG